MNNQTIQKLKEILLKKRKSIIQINKINAFIWNDLTKRYSTFLAALCIFIHIIIQIYQIPNWLSKDGNGIIVAFVLVLSFAISGIFTVFLIIYLFIERKNNIKIKENKFTNNKFIKILVLMLYFLFIICAPFFLYLMPYIFTI